VVRHLSEAPSACLEAGRSVPAGTLADVTERLLAEFDPRLSLTTIIATVQECRRELDGAPPCPSSSSGSRGSG
jgi:hypothetical protein